MAGFSSFDKVSALAPYRGDPACRTAVNAMTPPCAQIGANPLFGGYFGA